ncbi:MAG: hypothetical protein MJ206_02080 [Bacilli bacterium]|nr:hypothetical protein [Bacilli bacterium]
MESFFNAITVPAMWVIAFLELFGACFALYKSRKLINVLFFIECIGLSIDAFIQVLGVYIGVSQGLLALSYLRFVLHGILVPLLIPIAYLLSGSKWNKIIIYAITGVVMVFGIIMAALVKLEPVDTAGILRYQMSEATSKFVVTINQVISIGGVIPLFLFGVIALIKKQGLWVLLSGIFMLIFAAIGGPVKALNDYNFFLTAIGEVLMMACLLMPLVLKKKKIAPSR